MNLHNVRSKIVVTAVSEQLDLDQVTEHVSEECYRGHNKGKPLSPMAQGDIRHRIAPVTSAFWKRYFVGDGSEVLTGFIQSFTDRWELLKLQASETDIQWTLSILFYGSASGDYVAVDSDTARHFADLGGTIETRFG